MHNPTYFYFKNGRVAKTVEDLSDILNDLSEEEFVHHVNEFKNDFAQWIQHAMKDFDLATKVRKCITRGEMVSVLNESLLRKEVTEGFENKKEVEMKESGKIEEPEQQEIEQVEQEYRQKDVFREPSHSEMTSRREFTLKEFILGVILGFVLGFVICRLIFGILLKN